jgi:hypothetical protein
VIARRKKIPTGHVARMGELRNLYIIFVENLRGIITGCQPCQVDKYTSG